MTSFLTSLCLAMSLIALTVGPSACRSDSESAASDGESARRYDPRMSGRDYSEMGGPIKVLPTVESGASEGVEGIEPPDLVLEDAAGLYRVVMNPRLWRPLTGAAVEAVHAEATVAWAGPDGCVGALIVTKREVKKYGEMEPTARARLASVPGDKARLLWFDPTRYNNRPGFRWTAKAQAAPGATPARYQYSIASRDGFVFEVIARSPSHFSLARWCHDAVTAAVTF